MSLPDDAISLISRYSKGIPRVINILCDNAFLIGYALSQKKLDAADYPGGDKRPGG